MYRKSNLDHERARLLTGVGFPEKVEFVADDFQKEAINSVAEGHDTLVVAPTGAGKTYIAIQAIAVALGLNAKAVYTSPLKALSNSKYTELKRLFEPQYKVGLLTGDRKIDTDANVVVATTEIYRNELYRDYGRFGVVVLDEVHFISDLQRGPVWEESIILTPKEATLLMLSASISNPEEIAAWLEDVRGKPCKIVMKKERPVELRLGFLHPDLGVLPLFQKSGELLPEVLNYYSDLRLDATGKRLVEHRSGGDRSSSRRGRSGRRSDSNSNHNDSRRGNFRRRRRK